MPTVTASRLISIPLPSCLMAGSRHRFLLSISIESLPPPPTLSLSESQVFVYFVLFFSLGETLVQEELKGSDRDREKESMSGAGQEEDKKPADQSAHINLKVKGQDGNEVFFRIKRSTQLRKLMNAYCDRQSVDFNSIAFLFDGRRLRGEQTPDELEMEDGDEIDAMLHQTGGGL
uniref:Small ubiquitin-related modifier 1 n=3 Tax=Cocoseae TaxID=169705 RepID=A0A6I9RQJ4_ELAGV|nr:small ubiquitin-related modifier 1 [Elaeis guineensis]